MKKRSFALGYSFVFHSFLMYLFYVGITTNGINTIVGTFASLNGIDQESLLAINTPAALVGPIVGAFVAQIVMKYGVKKVTVVSLIIGGVLGTMLLGWATTVTGYLVAMVFSHIAGCGYAQNTTNTLIATWFPRKKGIMLGFSTCGIALAGVVMVKVLSLGFDTVGYRASMTFLGALMVILGVVSMIWVKDTPEEVGLYPDNIPPTAEELKDGTMSMDGASDGGGWTLKMLLQTKTTWLLIFGMGITCIATVTYTATSVYFFMENSFSRADALSLYSLCALLIFIGSTGIGWIDTRFGVKAAIIANACLQIGGFAVCLVLPAGRTCAIVSAVLGLTSCGAISNLCPSATASVFGRKAFAASIRVVGTGGNIIKGFTFALVAYLVRVTGSYINCYKIMAFVALAGLIILLFVNYKEVLQPPTSRVKAQ